MARAPDEDQLGGEGADAGKFPQAGEGLPGRQGAERRRVETAVQRRLGQSLQPPRLDRAQARYGIEAAQHGGEREGVRRPARDRQGLAVRAGQPVLDRRRARHPQPVADHGPRGGLVRREEAHRAQAGELCLEPSHDGIGPAHGREAAPVHVERQDARHLGAYGGGRGPVRRPSDAYRPRVPRLPHRAADDVQAVVRREGEPQDAVVVGGVRGGREVRQEAEGGRQGEGPLRHQ
ncbi:hypothetical protein [Streptomyces sp. NRRL F-5630]|uniref:hypothetical protein n=1 Tax=Streptomyces sp. NRRL F-5630 TaxID=1463864 RepID=UPI003D732D47